ncbi:hypothetical protein AB2553_14160 [Bacillus mycoides]|uniref:hypothetical protein n=1 Tax=Bacillus mycoides TaxID=1405 RepID=UPI003464962E
MKEEYKNLFQQLINSIHEYVNENVTSERNNMFIRSMLGEAYLSIDTLLENQVLKPHENVILNRDLSKIYHQVYNEQSLYFYSSFHYAYQNIKKGDVEEIQNQFQKINLDVMAMLINIKSIMKDTKDLGSSTEDYFFSRMENCTWAFTYVIRNGIEEYFIPSLYCICNMKQTLLLYLKAGKSKYSVEANMLLNVLKKVLRDFGANTKVKEILDSNKQLKYFLASQIYERYQFQGDSLSIDINIDEVTNERTRGALRILTSIHNINHDKFKEYFEIKFEDFFQEAEEMQILDKILLLRILSNYCKLIGETSLDEELGLYEEISSISTVDFINQVFKLDEVNISSVTQEHLNQLLLMKDDELRMKFSKSINGVEERILNRESQKPHGAFEISDMEVPILFRGKRYYMCMPFKSGVEIRGNSVPVEIAYQIVRPFIEFTNCVVVFVTAKRCSENLMNYIKKLKDKQGWPIEVIEEKTLAALLINAGQL